MAKINTEYDVGSAFEAIEEELISSMIRNMERHKLEEIEEDKQWSMWQAEQLSRISLSFKIMMKMQKLICVKFFNTIK